MYPICHADREFLASAAFTVDRHPDPVHFWDPMQNRGLFADYLAPAFGATDPRAMGMMTTIITITTTRMRGASG